MTVNELRDTLDVLQKEMEQYDFGELDIRFDSGYQLTHLELVIIATEDGVQPPQITLKGDK